MRRDEEEEETGRKLEIYQTKVGHHSHSTVCECPELHVGELYGNQYSEARSIFSRFGVSWEYLDDLRLQLVIPGVAIFYQGPEGGSKGRLKRLVELPTVL